MFHRYYYFSSGVPFFQIPDSFRDVTQWVPPVDDRSDFSGSKRYLSRRLALRAAIESKMLPVIILNALSLTG